MRNTCLDQVKALRPPYSDEILYTRVMEGISKLGENPKDEDVKLLLDILKEKSCESYKVLKDREEEFEVPEEFRIANIVKSGEDLKKGGLSSALLLVGCIIDEGNKDIEEAKDNSQNVEFDHVRITLGIINQPGGRIANWLEAKKALIRSSEYQRKKAEDLSKMYRNEER